MNRQEGYYWVNLANHWFVGKFCLPFKYWLLSTDGETKYEDSEFFKINETRILSPDEQHMATLLLSKNQSGKKIK